MPNEPCPDDEVFLALKDGVEVPESVREHITHCPHCQQRLSHLSAVILSLRAIVSDATVLDEADATMQRVTESHATLMDGEKPSTVDPRLTERFQTEKPGRFQLIRMLGKGAFGEVHLAFDPNLDRKVAIKVAQKGTLVGKSQVDRFEREAQAAAQLRHPNIIPVYDVGKSGSMNYIVYEFVEGQSLRAVLVFRRKLEQLEAATIAAKLAAALHYAHSHGIVHRDIKPDNILMDEKGEPHIADFGLAYRDEAETLRTREGILMGTPAYMSPEQATGRGHDVDPRADIWSLGVLLQEMLTGERPFEGPLNQILSSIQKAEPKPFDDSGVSRDLQAICRTCLAKNVSSRYQTAQELALDLERWKRGEPVQVRPLGTLSKTIRWARRNPGVAKLVATVIGVLVTGLVASGYFALKANQQARLARELQKERAVVQVAALQTVTAESIPFLVKTLWDDRVAIRPRLVELLAEPGLGTNAQVRFRLGLAAFADGNAEHGLLMQLSDDMTTASAAEFLTIREVLQPYADQLRAGLWLQVLHPDEHSPDARFRAACALAAYDPEASHWASVADDVVDQLTVGEVSEVLAWTTVVQPIRTSLLPRLRDMLRDGEDDEQRYRAAAVIAQLFSDDPELLIEIARQAGPRQLRPLLSVLKEIPELDQPITAILNEQSGESQAAITGRANMAMLLLARLSPEFAVSLMKQSPNLSTRTRLIHGMGAAGIDPTQVIAGLRAAIDPFVASGLVLSLGEYESDRLNGSRRRRLLPELLQVFRNHPDPGLHSAIDWLLRHWGFAEEVTAAEQSLQSRDPREGRRWYVTRQGNTMAILRGPVRYWMGSPNDEADRSPIEEHHEVEIAHSFAIGSKEITNKQFRAFQAHAYDPSTKKYSPDPNCPVISVSWYDAIKFCRWLSEQEEIPEDQMCFPPIDKIGPDMPESAIHLDRTGYRLATATEWEYACRAGTVTSRHFGEPETWLPSYAWFSANSQNRTWPVGSLKPNGFGLFDMHANALEWCQNAFFDWSRPSGQELVVEAAGSAQGPQYELRGGTFLHAPAVTRSAWRDYQVASYPSYEFGLRVARTYNEELDD